MIFYPVIGEIKDNDCNRNHKTRNIFDELAAKANKDLEK